MDTLDFVFYLLAAICFFLGLVWWRGAASPAPGPGPGFSWSWPLYLGLLFFTLPPLINAAQHLK